MKKTLRFMAGMALMGIALMGQSMAQVSYENQRTANLEEAYFSARDGWYVTLCGTVGGKTASLSIGQDGTGNLSFHKQNDLDVHNVKVVSFKPEERKYTIYVYGGNGAYEGKLVGTMDDWTDMGDNGVIVKTFFNCVYTSKQGKTEQCYLNMTY